MIIGSSWGNERIEGIKISFCCSCERRRMLVEMGGEGHRTGGFFYIV